MELGALEILLSLLTVILGVYAYATRSFDYWKKLGVPGPKPSIPFGNFADVFLGRKVLIDKLQEFYEAYKNEPFVGYFVGRHPVLMIKDPDLIKQVLIKDFDVFSSRGIRINVDVDPLLDHLFNIDGARWKVLRRKLTPTFTSGKLKNMFNLMSECADNFERHLKNEVETNNRVECREHAARYSTDVIGSCAFGLDTKALADEDSEFRKIGRMIFHVGLDRRIKRLMAETSPRLYSLLRLSIHRPEVTRFFARTMRETVESRKKNNIVRNDFVDLLLQIPKDRVEDGFGKYKIDLLIFFVFHFLIKFLFSEWTNNFMTAQAYVFFAAGFETSSTTISFALWELARAPRVQEKLRQEVLEFYNKNDGAITYEAVNDMKYLDMVVKETLRKNPPLVSLTRQSTRKYVIPGTNVTLPAGQSVQIPAYALQHDERFYPEPETFDPERFSEEAKLAGHPVVFLPFGDGPKNCIGKFIRTSRLSNIFLIEQIDMRFLLAGARFGSCQVKLALIKVMKNFRVKPTTSVDQPYVVDKNVLFLAPLGGVVLEFEPLDVRNLT